MIIDTRAPCFPEDKRPITVADAVKIHLDRSDYAVGDLELARDNISAIQMLLSRMVTMLHDKGVLDDHDVVQLICHHAVKVAEEADNVTGYTR